MYSIAIAVPGSAGVRDLIWYFTGKRYIQSSNNDLDNVHTQKNTLGVVLDASGIPKENQFIVKYPQNLNVIAPVRTSGDLGAATRPERDFFYGRSVDIGIRCLADTVHEIAEKVGYEQVKLLMVGYSQGAEILQSYLSTVVKTRDPKLVNWLASSLNISLFLANPARVINKNVKDICLSRTDSNVKRVNPINSGSLSYHSLFIPLELKGGITSRCVNVFWEDDVIAQLHESKKTKLGNLAYVTLKSLIVHTDYRKAKSVVEHLFARYKFTADVFEINKLGEADFISNFDSDERYLLAKKYLLTRVGSVSEFRVMLKSEAQGVPVDYLWKSFKLVPDTYGALGKVVQIAVWSRVAQLMSKNLNRGAYFHNISDELVAYGAANVTCPEHYIALLFREARKANKATEDNSVGSAIFSDLDNLYKVNTDVNRVKSTPSMNAAVARLVQDSWPVVHGGTYPDWLYFWDGNPQTKGVKKFLEEAVMDMQPTGKKRASLNKVLSYGTRAEFDKSSFLRGLVKF